ncbi:MAG: serine hydrolase domain-containing protein [Ferruginibacter sp.]
MKKLLLVPGLALLLLSSCSKSKTDSSNNNNNNNNNNNAAQVDLTQVDSYVSSFMTTYAVPGVSVAITKNGKLVYAKSYGKADQASSTDVKNTSLFRLASVSKPITAVAIMKLVEAGSLSLSDKVFGTGSVLGTMYGTQPYGTNIANITVDELLHHTAGGWTNDGNDPMFTNINMTQAQLISWTLDNRPLDHVPGTNYAYSNFGFCVLGRIIEKVSGQSYEDYVKANVLAPSGITDMQISGNTLADKKPNEVTYYGQGGEDPYIYNIARMDAHGGWLATATDLARFLVHIDGYTTKPDIINSASISTMTAGSSANADYGCGWSVNAGGNWWHLGSLPGTCTEIVRSSNGFCWVVLCNTRSTSANFSTDMDGLIWHAVNDNTTAWQDIDQF